MRRSAAWLFEDYPDGTFLRESQVLSTGFLRLQTVIAFRPMRRLLRRVARS